MPNKFFNNGHMTNKFIRCAESPVLGQRKKYMCYAFHGKIHYGPSVGKTFFVILFKGEVVRVAQCNQSHLMELQIDTFNTLRIHLFLRREQQ